MSLWLFWTFRVAFAARRVVGHALFHASRLFFFSWRDSFRASTFFSFSCRFFVTLAPARRPRRALSREGGDSISLHTDPSERTRSFRFFREAWRESLELVELLDGESRERRARPNSWQRPFGNEREDRLAGRRSIESGKERQKHRH